MGIFEAKVCVWHLWSNMVAPSVMIVFGVIVNLADFVAGLFLLDLCYIILHYIILHVFTSLQYSM